MALKIFKQKSRWYWIVLDGNGNPLAYSAKSYKRADDARRAFNKLDRMF
jgi:hypothetical protein